MYVLCVCTMWLVPRAGESEGVRRCRCTHEDVCGACLCNIFVCIVFSALFSILTLTCTPTHSHTHPHPHILTFNHHPHTHHLHTHTFTPSHSHPHLHTLTQILVECGTTGGKWLFPCHRWLCLDAGDGRIERELHPTVEEKEGRGGERRWRVHVWTSDIRGAGTDANVTLQVSQLGILTLLLCTSPLKDTLATH